MKRTLLLLALLPFCAAFGAQSSDWTPNTTVSAAWMGNVSNGSAVWDRISTLQLGLNALSTMERDLTRSDAYYLSTHIGGEWYPRFLDLSQAELGARIGWRHTFGVGDFAPVFGLEGAGDWILASDKPRRGALSAVTLKIGKRFASVWRATLSQRFDDYAAQRAVFDSRGSETSLEIGRDFGNATRILLTGRWREGDIVTYANYDRPDLMAIARDSAVLETFDNPMTAYSTKARTIAGRISLLHATSAETALVLSYEYARTNRTGLKFANSAIVLSFVEQF